MTEPRSELVPKCLCGHAAADHDAIGSRFCEATLTGALVRGCICRPVAAVSAR